MIKIKTANNNNYFNIIDIGAGHLNMLPIIINIICNNNKNMIINYLAFESNKNLIPDKARSF
jgi:hypothetical protein